MQPENPREADYLRQLDEAETAAREAWSKQAHHWNDISQSELETAADVMHRNRPFLVQLGLIPDNTTA